MIRFIIKIRINCIYYENRNKNKNNIYDFNFYLYYLYYIFINILFFTIPFIY